MVWLADRTVPPAGALKAPAAQIMPPVRFQPLAFRVKAPLTTMLSKLLVLLLMAGAPR